MESVVKYNDHMIADMNTSVTREQLCYHVTDVHYASNLLTLITMQLYMSLTFDKYI